MMAGILVVQPHTLVILDTTLLDIALVIVKIMDSGVEWSLYVNVSITNT